MSNNSILGNDPAIAETFSASRLSEYYSTKLSVEPNGAGWGCFVAEILQFRAVADRSLDVQYAQAVALWADRNSLRDVVRGSVTIALHHGYLTSAEHRS